MFYYEFGKISKKTFFNRTPPVAVSNAALGGNK